MPGAGTAATTNALKITLVDANFGALSWFVSWIGLA